MSFTIVGLGNPGRKYNKTRHNIGRDALKRFAESADLDAFEESMRLSGRTTRGRVSGEELVLLLPDTFMNKSGISVKEAVPTEAKARDELIVVHDDIDLPLGEVRVSFDKSAGGHNGVASIIAALDTQEFARIRIGIAPTDEEGEIQKPASEYIRDFVLGRFKPEEKEVLEEGVFPAIEEAIELLIEKGREEAMNEINR